MQMSLLFYYRWAGLWLALHSCIQVKFWIGLGVDANELTALFFGGPVDDWLSTVVFKSSFGLA